VVVAAGLSSLACGPDLPDRMWRSENVRYFSRAGDDSVCPAIVDQLEEHGAVIADALRIQRSVVSYYKFADPDDFAANAECGSGAAACAPNATVRSPADFDRHELIHAYLSPYGRPPWLIAEGAAVALSCQHYPRPTGSWRDGYGADHASLSLYGAGGWLVGYLLRMFRSTWFVELYGRVQINATADQFAAVFKDIYGTELDAVWAGAIGEAQIPVHCPWECSRPGIALDGQPRALSAACGTGSVQLSVDVPSAGLTRWRVEGGAYLLVQSCDGNESPLASVSGSSGPGELLATFSPGTYAVEAFVDSTATLAASVDPSAGVSWSDCASAPALPDDVAGLASLSLFYPTSTTAQFTALATGTDRLAQALVTSDDPGATIGWCTACDAASCVLGDAGHPLAMPATPPGTVVSVPPGAARTVSFFWF
jgi:hypothetical protein